MAESKDVERQRSGWRLLDVFRASLAGRFSLMFLALLILERGLMTLQAWILKPGPHHPPEHYASPVTVVLAAVFLALSLRRA